jgi:hypothetical protein
MVTLVDDFSVGPLRSLSDVGEWWAMRRSFWASTLTEQDESPRRWAFLYNDRALAEAERIVVWAADGLADQLALLWWPRYLHACGVDPDLLRLAWIPRTRWPPYPGSHHMRGAGPARWPRDAEVRCLAEVWDAVTASDPERLNELLERENPLLPRLTHALKDLVSRYPSASSGLTVHDEVLLATVQRRGPRVASVIAYTLAALDRLGDRVGDWVLFDRLRNLGTGPRPAVVVVGGNEIRDTEARLTEDGEQFLAGKRSWVELNGVNEWVAGVHLDSSSNRVWYREGGRVVPA